jgi:hypothetical protein
MSDHQKKTLAARMADAEKQGLLKQNEWQLGMDKLRERDGVDAPQTKNVERLHPERSLASGSLR